MAVRMDAGDFLTVPFPASFEWRGATLLREPDTDHRGDDVCAFMLRDNSLTIWLWWAPGTDGASSMEGPHWWASAAHKSAPEADEIGEAFLTAARAVDSAVAVLLARLDKPGREIRARFPRNLESRKRE